VRRGVLCALRSRAALEVLFSAGLPGVCAKRSGRGVLVDLMPRMHVYATAGRDDCVAFCWRSGRSERVDDGRRNAGGSRPQLRGAMGGIMRVVAWRCCLVVRVVLLEIFGMVLGPKHVKLPSSKAGER
jgi:hypothetical protein